MISSFQQISEKLLAARLGPLDGLANEISQSVIVEILFWGILYNVFAQIFSRLLRFTFKRYSFWEGASQRTGVIAGNAQDDLIIMWCLAVHHILGGSMMVYASHVGSSTLFRHAMLSETGFEVFDLICMVCGTFPYTHFVKPELKVGMIFHHTPSIMMATSVIEFELNKSHHLQTLGAWLLLAGGVSCLVSAVSHMLDFSTQMKTAAGLQVFNWSFFVYARYYVFPLSVWGLYLELSSPDSGVDSFLINKALVAGAFFVCFNMIIMADLTPKTLRYVQRGFIDQKTKLETSPVPLSKEQREKKDLKLKSL